jgi:hypothetical protein
MEKLCIQIACCDRPEGTTLEQPASPVHSRGDDFISRIALASGSRFEDHSKFNRGWRFVDLVSRKALAAGKCQKNRGKTPAAQFCD